MKTISVLCLMCVWGSALAQPGFTGPLLPNPGFQQFQQYQQQYQQPIQPLQGLQALQQFPATMLNMGTSMMNNIMGMFAPRPGITPFSGAAQPQAPNPFALLNPMTFLQPLLGAMNTLPNMQFIPRAPFGLPFNPLPQFGNSFNPPMTYPQNPMPYPGTMNVPGMAPQQPNAIPAVPYAQAPGQGQSPCPTLPAGVTPQQAGQQGLILAYNALTTTDETKKISPAMYTGMITLALQCGLITEQQKQDALSKVAHVNDVNAPGSVPPQSSVPVPGSAPVVPIPGSAPVVPIPGSAPVVPIPGSAPGVVAPAPVPAAQQNPPPL